MYSISALSRPSVEFVNRTSSVGGNRSDVFPIAVAYAVARTLPLPGMAVEDITQYFRLNCDRKASCSVDCVNEMLPFSLREAKELIMAFYKFRYRAANPAPIPLAFHAESALEDFFEISTFFSKGVLDRIKASPEALTKYINGLTILFTEDAVKRLADAGEAAASTERTDQYVAA